MIMLELVAGIRAMVLLVRSQMRKFYLEDYSSLLEQYNAERKRRIASSKEAAAKVGNPIWLPVHTLWAES